MNSAKQFLDPQSMLTPGVAGATAMVISNTLVFQFGLVKPPWPAVIVLIISFVFGLLVLASEVTPYWKRFAYYIVNSFIIFNVAVGSNTLGLSVGQPTSLASIVIPTTYAQPVSGWCCLNNRVNSSSREECKRWGGQYFSTQEEAERACRSGEAESQRDNREDRRFFRPWF